MPPKIAATSSPVHSRGVLGAHDVSETTVATTMRAARGKRIVKVYGARGWLPAASAAGVFMMVSNHGQGVGWNINTAENGVGANSTSTIWPSQNVSTFLTDFLRTSGNSRAAHDERPLACKRIE